MSGGTPRYSNEAALDPAPESSWGKLLAQVPQGARVLDVGCARGAFSGALQRLRDCRVIGVEVDEQAAEEARSRCEAVVCGDIQKLLADPAFPRDFDVIIAADVLEHLLDPKGVLESLTRTLKPGGVLLASIPNVTHLSVIAALATGRFPRSREGLLDSTHVQFFGEADALELFEQSGYAAKVVDRVQLDPRLTEFHTDLAALPAEALAFFDQHRNSDTYQFIIRAVPHA
ncbi:MAG: class I SAM-dependent methyltransferase, partial [Myxococcaceae bacterium]